MPQSKERKAEYQRDFRAKQKGTSLEGTSEVGTSEAWYPNKRKDSKGRPITPVTLSDGQKWYPSGDKQILIEKSVNLHTGQVLCLDNGSYIHIKKLVNKKSRGLITYIEEHLKKEYQSDLRVGVQGATIAECKELLEVTA